MYENPRDRYVVDKNKRLYDRLESKYYIQLYFFDSPYDDGFSPWQCTIDKEKKVVTVRYFKKVETTGYFTHELFHVALVDNGFYTTDELLLKLPFKNIDKYSINDFNNVIAHPKFYDDFINLNYQPSEFFCDFNKDFSKIIAENVLIVEEAFNSKTYSDESINSFLIIFFIAIFGKNDKYQKKYSDDLSYLNIRVPKLFSIIETHWTAWKNSKMLDNLDFFTHLFTDINSWRLTEIKEQ